MRKLIAICTFALLAACNACNGPPPLVVDVVDADMGAPYHGTPGHCLSHPDCGNAEDGGTP